MAGRPLSRRLGPASRLVPVLAARGLRHARPRALRRGGDAWLRRRRGRAQDVEIARQRGGAAGRDPPVGRRDPAAVGHELGLRRGSCASAPRSSRPMSSPIASSGTRCAICSAISPITKRASPCLTPRCPSSSATCSRVSPSSNDAVREGYWAFDFKRAFHALLNFCRQRSLRFLFRYPQGRALLRPLRQPDAARRADRARQGVRRAHRVARPHALLHHGGGLAQSLPRG